jgi:hypothetical protein
LEERGVKINRKKTEFLSFNEANKKSISMQGYELKKVANFKYLGSTLSEDEEIDLEVEKRIQAGWMKWILLSRVLCDERISTKVKGKVFKVAVRPAMTYSAKT